MYKIYVQETSIILFPLREITRLVCLLYQVLTSWRKKNPFLVSDCLEKKQEQQVY